MSSFDEDDDESAMDNQFLWDMEDNRMPIVEYESG
jgi:hypothetical protein